MEQVVEVLVVLEYARRAAAGQLDARDRTRVRAGDRLGGLGTAGCLDVVDISWRDLAYLAMSISDNTAADLLLRASWARQRAGAGLGATRAEGAPRQAVEIGCNAQAAAAGDAQGSPL